MYFPDNPQGVRMSNHGSVRVESIIAEVGFRTPFFCRNRISQMYGATKSKGLHYIKMLIFLKDFSRACRFEKSSSLEVFPKRNRVPSLPVFLTGCFPNPGPASDIPDYLVSALEKAIEKIMLICGHRISVSKRLNDLYAHSFAHGRESGLCSRYG